MYGFDAVSVVCCCFCCLFSVRYRSQHSYVGLLMSPRSMCRTNLARWENRCLRVFHVVIRGIVYMPNSDARILKFCVHNFCCKYIRSLAISRKDLLLYLFIYLLTLTMSVSCHWDCFRRWIGLNWVSEFVDWVGLDPTSVMRLSRMRLALYRGWLKRSRGRVVTRRETYALRTTVSCRLMYWIMHMHALKSTVHAYAWFNTSPTSLILTTL